MTGRLVGVFLVCCVSPTHAQEQSIDAERFLVDDDMIIETRDGTPISAIVVTDNDATTVQPTALFFTIYTNSQDVEIAKYAARKGYASVVAYARGVKTDAADIVPYEHDAEDVYDVVEWIAGQAWSNGSVGMYGGSYAGFVQWAVARLHPPALKTIVPQVAAAPGIGEPMENGVFITQLAYNWPLVNVLDGQLPDDFYSSWYESGAPYRDLDRFSGYRNPIFRRWLEHPTFDEFWRGITTDASEFESIDIPVLTTTGYYDDAQPSALYYFREHHRYNDHAQHYLVIGPYDHFGGQINASAQLRGYAIDPVARTSMGDLAFEWFDYALKGMARPALVADIVNYQVMGTNEWHHAPSLQRMSNETLRLYLGTEKRGDFNLLTTEPSDAARAHVQIVDFADRQTQNNDFTPLIIRDELPASNGIVFASEVFDEPIELSGSLAGLLKVTTNKKDFDVSVALYERLPDGRYFFLNRHLARASLARDRSNAELMSPGETYTIPLRDTRVTSKALDAGSRIVVVVNVNKNAFEEINYGTGEAVSEESTEDAGTPLEVLWHADSYIELPIRR